MPSELNDDQVLENLHKCAEEIRNAEKKYHATHDVKDLQACHNLGKRYAPTALEAYKRRASIVRINPNTVCNLNRGSGCSPDEVGFWTHIDAITCLDEAIEMDKHRHKDAQHAST